MVDFGELGNFSTEYPWSDVNPFSDGAFGILGPRPAVLPDHPDSIQTYFRLRLNIKLMLTRWRSQSIKPRFIVHHCTSVYKCV